MFILLNLGNSFCSNFYGGKGRDDTKEEVDKQAKCFKAANGLANNGLKLSITAVITKCTDIIVKYY